MERERLKKVREKEKADQAAERARKKEAQNAKRALQLPQKGERKAPCTPTQKSKGRKRVVDAVGSEESPGAASAAPLKTTRSGRSVNLPSKFR